MTTLTVFLSIGKEKFGELCIIRQVYQLFLLQYFPHTVSNISHGYGNAMFHCHDNGIIGNISHCHGNITGDILIMQH